MTDVAKVKAMNTALALLGQEPVADLNDAALQASGAATKLLRHIDDARDAVLARHGWVDALAYTQIPPIAAPTVAAWRYPWLYQLGADALLVWELDDEQVTPPNCDTPLTSGCLASGRRWQLGTIETAPDTGGARTVIRSSSDGLLNVCYVRRAAWAAMRTHLRDAVAHETAARGAYQVTVDLAKAVKVRDEAEKRIMLAISTDATQEGGQPAWASSTPAGIRNLSR